MNKINLFWFRRDLRIQDNTGLYHSLKSGLKVMPIFIFDSEILDCLEDQSDRRVDYIHQALLQIHKELQSHNSGVRTFFGKPADIFRKILKEYDVDTVYCNRDYEPQAIKRDQVISDLLNQNQVKFEDFKDQVIFEKNNILKSDGSPYTIFTPYSKKWKSALNKLEILKISYDNFLPLKKHLKIHTLDEIGFKNTDLKFFLPKLDENIINSYDENRDFPAKNHTTKLGVALRFGTISIRECVNYALEKNEIWLTELIWREFFMQILYHFPYVVNGCFKNKYEAISWINNEKDFKAWCEGKTGYPIVDAGMRQLNTTGFMHNRVRMITASFLTKHLLIDWRWGEAYFAQKLLDYDLAANNGNWQWVAGCGCDAAPYFRIFNPDEQTKKFDKNFNYIKKWIPENYNIQPIIDHRFARDRALKTYKKALV